MNCDSQRWACISAAANITNTSSFPLLSPACVLSQAMIDRSFAAQSDATALRSSHFWLLSLCCTRKSTAGFCRHSPCRLTALRGIGPITGCSGKTRPRSQPCCLFFSFVIFLSPHKMPTTVFDRHDDVFQGRLLPSEGATCRR